jgi:hypothetical protein
MITGISSQWLDYRFSPVFVSTSGGLKFESDITPISGGRQKGTFFKGFKVNILAQRTRH